MRASLLRSTPFRVALLLSVTLLAALTIAGGIAQFLVRQELADRLDASISDTFAVISQSFGDGDLADLEASVASHAQNASHGIQVFRLMSTDGHVLASNIGSTALPPGWSNRNAAGLGLKDRPADYRLFTGSVGGNQLVVGSSLAEIDEIWRLVAASLIWSALIFVGLVLLIGGLIALRAQRRLDGIAATMRLVGQGNLEARIPLVGRGDDVDRLAISVNTALDRLAALVEGMRQVSVDIAHDLKTPLGRLSITVESAIEATNAGEPVEDLLLEAQNEASRINATFEALLRIAQIEAGARRARFTTVELGSVMATVVELYEDLATERQQTISAAALDALPVVHGDRELLMQLFANLVENSLRHGAPGTGVVLAGHAQGEGGAVTVSDNGAGIPPEERERVFRRLYRMDKSRSTPGSGLGLSLVKAIADLHGAAIALEDNHPGLRVTVSFPSAATPRA